MDKTRVTDRADGSLFLLCPFAATLYYTNVQLQGASGAGKTTLLEVLANRISTGVVSGEKMIGANYRHHGFTRKIGYAQQQDIHLATSTVREALEFSALLRQPGNNTRMERLAHVKDVIDILDMADF